MKRISGGQLSREAKPRFYQVTPKVLGRRRATQALPVRPKQSTQKSRVARRRPEDLPDGSDVTTQTPKTMTVRVVRTLRRRRVFDAYCGTGGIGLVVTALLAASGP